MYSMIKNSHRADLITTQVPALTFALVIAEALFKWKSFALECIGFLAVWFVLDFAITRLRAAWLRKRQAAVNE